MPISEILKTVKKILLFRFTAEDIAGLNKFHLQFGLICTWVVGIGRYWDNSRAELLQTLGLGSLIYIFVLSFFLWLIIWSLGPKNWEYKNILTFVSLTSPPAILYAIPVEQFMALDTARSLNVWFLAIVAIWRVTLLVLYLRRYCQLPASRVFVGTFLPLVIIVAALSLLNLEHAVFNVMAGNSTPPTTDDAAYQIVVLITLLSIWLLPVFLIMYFYMVIKSRQVSKKGIN